MTQFKRAAGALAVSALLASSAAFAADSVPLPAGKPAGTKEAALLGLPVILIGVGVLAAIIAVAVSNNDDNSPTTPNTTVTSTTGT